MENCEIPEAYDELVFRINQLMYDLLLCKHDPEYFKDEIAKITGDADHQLTGREDLKGEIFSKLLDITVKMTKLMC